MKRDNLVILNVINFISESYERSWTNFFFLIFRFLKHYFSMLFLGSNDFGQVYCYIWYDPNFYFKPTCSLPLKNVFYTSKLSSVLLPERNYAFPICTFLFPTSLQVPFQQSGKRSCIVVLEQDFFSLKPNSIVYQFDSVSKSV